MPTTPNLALPYPQQTDTADVPRDIQALAVKLDVVAGGPAVTSLPASPVDGQECYYVADAANGVVWHLRYRAASASTYKWELVGGPPLLSQTLSVILGAGFSSGVWAGITGQPSLTVPLAGDYDSEAIASMSLTGAGGGILLGVRVGATDPAFNVNTAAGQIPAAGNNTNLALRQRHAGLAAATTLAHRYEHFAGTAQNMNVSGAVLTARPVRVG